MSTSATDQHNDQLCRLRIPWPWPLVILPIWKITSVGMSTDIEEARRSPFPDAGDTVLQAMAPTEIPSQPPCFLSGVTAPVGAPCGAFLHAIKTKFTKTLSGRCPYSPLGPQPDNKTKLVFWPRERSKYHRV